MQQCVHQDLPSFLRECVECPEVDNVVEEHIMATLIRNLHFTTVQWSKYSINETVEASYIEIKSALVRQLTVMVTHSFIVKHQLRQIKNLKTTQKDEVILQEDFSENFNIKQQNEIISAHWKSNDSTSNVTLFIAIIYTSASQYSSFAVVSDCLDHDKYAVVAFNQAILAEAVKLNLPIHTVHVF